MKKLSVSKMSDTVISKRKEAKMTQAQLAEATGINRGMISRLESCDYIPSIEQLQSIAEVLHFEVVDLFEDDKPQTDKPTGFHICSGKIQEASIHRKSLWLLRCRPE